MKSAGTSKGLLAALGTGLFSLLAYQSAFAAPPPTPFGGGQILQQVQPPLPPSPQTPLPPLRKKGPPSRKVSGPAIHVNRFRIVGNTLFKTEILHALVENGEGFSLRLSEIRAYADKITAYYRAHGYPLSFAVVPKQTVRNGVVTIRVIETRYGKTRLHNASRVSTPLLSSTLSGTQTGRPVASGPLTSDLLLLSDIPGTKVSTLLSPGTEPGTSDLEVNVGAAPMATGTVSFDDYGNPYTGELELNATGSANNLLHRGDVLAVSLTSSLGMNYGQIRYDILLNGDGTRLGLEYSAMDYRVGNGIDPIRYGGNQIAAQALGASGYAQTAGAWVLQPLVRTPTRNLTLNVGYTRYILSDTFSQASGAVDDRTLDVFTASLTGNATDEVFGGGRTDATLSYSPYYLALTGGNPALNPYGSTTPGFRSVWRGLLSRTQTLPGTGNSLFVSASGQMATGALDPAEQYVVGGPMSVAAFATAILFGDQGYLTTAELRHDSAFGAVPGTFRSSLFFDASEVTYAGELLSFAGPGAGERWQGPSGWNASIEISTPTGAVPTVAGSVSSVQAWFQVAKSY
ncbi:MAG: hypothetical protein M1313_02340 [Nitrospirae bacterium]|nr:hypothetical protein [Nitrospirota bacterium]